MYSMALIVANRSPSWFITDDATKHNIASAPAVYIRSNSRLSPAQIKTSFMTAPK